MSKASDLPGAGERTRADYAPIEAPRKGAWIASIEPGSPAEREGLYPGLRVDTVNGVELDDIITWRWEASDGEVELELTDADGEEYYCELTREVGQDWGIEFSDVLFDGIRTCRNACVFCFMQMLPKEVRSTLYLRDDDYRLSFLQGNFVTLTNMSDADVERVIQWRLEPMNVSLHAVSPECRARLMGRNAQRGMDVLERLCDAGIEIHAQIVLCPGYNDGDEFRRTLEWVESHPQVTSLAVVPLGYTKYSTNFSSSFSEDVEASREVIEIIRPFQQRARERCGRTLFQLSDEFYLDAHVEVPPAETYDGYPQFYDGIGMLRSFIDETDLVLAEKGNEVAAISSGLEARCRRVLLVCGEAAEGVVGRLCREWVLTSHVGECPIHNDYYGGDVNVTGLIVGCDLLAQLPEDLASTDVVLPESMFNFADVTLDDFTRADIEAEISRRGGICHVSQTSPRELAVLLGRIANG